MIMREETVKMDSRPGARPMIPTGQNLVDQVRKGMAADHKNNESAARAVGLGQQTYQLVRRLLILTERRGDVAELDKIAMIDVLSKIPYQMSMRDAFVATMPMMKKYWRSGTKFGVPFTKEELAERANDYDRRRRADGKTRRRFDNTLFAIREACGNNDEMKLPELTRKDADEAADLIIRSMGNLAQLFAKLREGRDS
jgi:hypothetical protein